MRKAELEAELKRMTSRSDAHFQNYLEMLRNVDKLTVELREARTLLHQFQTALACILCTGESDCPTERDARKLCADALVKLNAELNTKNTKSSKTEQSDI